LRNRKGRERARAIKGQGQRRRATLAFKATALPSPPDAGLAGVLDLKREGGKGGLRNRMGRRGKGKEEARAEKG
jgi:hypothetical protein